MIRYVTVDVFRATKQTHFMFPTIGRRWIKENHRTVCSESSQEGCMKNRMGFLGRTEDDGCGLSLLSCAALFVLIGIQVTGFAQTHAVTKGNENHLGSIAKSYYEQMSSERVPVGHSGKIDAMGKQVLSGQSTSEFFGVSVACAGDVNGDGYPDVIVGAPGYNAFQGRAFIFFGGPGMDDVPDVILTGVAVSSFGTSVSSAGDVNGDGYADVIVGANQYDGNTGRAYIYYGGQAMDNIADVTLTGETTGDQFGISVSTAGDVNGDGFADVVVGANHYSSNTGRAYIYYGGQAVDNIADVTLTGETAGDQFGISVSTAGDVNGDGFADVVVGANHYSSSTGRAYIYFGGSSMDNSPDVLMTGESAGSNFGISVSTAGDANGDGYADVVVGANQYSSNTGRAYVYFGGTGMDNAADVILTGETAGDHFGRSVSSAGDVNGDGYADVIVGADAYDSYTGKVYVFFGGAGMDNIPDMTLTGEAFNGEFGASVSPMGDLDGDGLDEFIAGAFNFNSSTGRAYIYKNSMLGSDIPSVAFSGKQVLERFGYSVACAGDVNGDGYRDIIVGAPPSGYYDSGSVYIFFGGPNMDTTADIVLEGAGAFGFSVAGAGDVNGDGYSDVIVGAPGSYYGADSGKVYIYFGGTVMGVKADVILTDTAYSTGFGYSVAGAGDLNGDGFSDVIVGIPGNSAGGYSAGAAYVYFGGPSMNATPDVRIYGAAAGDQLGTSVASAGDVNKDGFSDVIVGAPYNDAGGTDAGAAYIYFGGATMNNVADVMLTGNTANDHFGSSVAGSGDVNGDGYSDVIVGAPNYNANAGAAYIYYGKFTMHNTPDVTLTGGGNNLGCSVAGAGDVNGDGYSDVIVGATYNSAGGDYAGRFYVYFGSPAMDSTPDIVATGAAGDLLGSSVAGADVNKDGYSDLVVGGIGGGGTGQVFLYYSFPSAIVPRITSVSDVPHDQGGKVTINWIRSGYDVKGISGIASYAIERSLPSGASGYSWEHIADVPSHNNLKYSYTCATPYDSTSSANGTYFFRVTAQTNNANEYWKSNIVEGHSVDNLPPALPVNFSVAANANAVALSWQTNPEPDLQGFQLFRATTSSIAPDTVKPLAFVRSTSYTDAVPLLNTKSFYFIRAQDVHGNMSPLSAPVSVTLAGSVRLTWEQTEGPFGGEVHALSSSNAGQLYAGTAQGGVYTSSDAGASWSQVSDGITSLDIVALAQRPDGELFSGSYGGGVYRSTDGGAHWIQANEGLPDGVYIQSLLVLNNGSVLAGTYGVGIYFSTDNGDTWNVSSSTDSRGNALIQDGNEHVYCATDNGVLVSSDNGQNWSQSGMADKSILSLIIGPSATLYAGTGTTEGVFRSTDHGSTWTATGLTSVDVTALAMDGSANLFAGTYSDGVFTSTDNGATWGQVNDSLTDTGIESLAFDTHGQLYAGTYGKGVFKAYHLLTNVATGQNGLPNVFSLRQNFPNPFNPTTTIRYSVPRSVHVILRVYDVLGRNVATLVDGQKSPGEYSIVMDGSRLSSGVYFYTIQAGSFTQTKKFALIK